MSRNRFLVLALVIAVAAIGCSREVEEYNEPGFIPEASATDSAVHPSSPGGTAAIPTTDSGATVVVMLSDGRIAAQSEIPQGPVVLNVSNGGENAHDLAIEGADTSISLGGPIDRGGSRVLEINLQPGQYTLYCPVLDHRQNGEQLEVTVGQ